MTKIKDSLDELIYKVERIINVNNITYDELCKVIDYLILIDEESKILLENIKFNKNKIFDNTVSILKHYNIIECSLPFKNRKTKTISINGKLKRIQFDINKYNIPTSIVQIIYKIKNAIK